MPWPADSVKARQAFVASRDKDGFSCERYLLVDPPDVTTAGTRAEELITFLWGDGGLTPAAHPRQPFSFVSKTTAYYLPEEDTPIYSSGDPLARRAYLTQVDIEQADCPVAVDVEYSPLDIGSPSNPSQGNVRAGTYATWESSWTGDFITMPSHKLFFQGSWDAGTNSYVSQVPGGAAPAVLLPLRDFTITWHNLDQATMNLIEPIVRDRTGKVNDLAFQLPAQGHVFPPETLCFMGARNPGTLNIAIDSDTGAASARTRNELTYTFREKYSSAFSDSNGQIPDTDLRGGKTPSADKTYAGWNHVLTPPEFTEVELQQVSWDRPVNADGETMHKLASFEELFNP